MVMQARMHSLREALREQTKTRAQVIWRYRKQTRIRIVRQASSQLRFRIDVRTIVYQETGVLRGPP